MGGTDLITYPHHTARGTGSNESTWHESLDACSLSCICERDLVEVRNDSDGTDNCINAGQNISKLGAVSDFCNMDLDATVLEF